MPGNGTGAIKNKTQLHLTPCYKFKTKTINIYKFGWFNNFIPINPDYSRVSLS